MGVTMKRFYIICAGWALLLALIGAMIFGGVYLTKKINDL